MKASFWISLAIYCLIASACAESAVSSIPSKGIDMLLCSVNPVSIEDYANTFTKMPVMKPPSREDVNIDSIPAASWDIKVTSVTNIQQLLVQWNKSSKIRGSIFKLGASRTKTVKTLIEQFASSYNYLAIGEIVVVTENQALKESYVVPAEKVDDQFKKAGELLPETYTYENGAEFASFIGAFGTHVVVDVTVGGKIVFFSFFKLDNYTTLTQTGANVESGLKIQWKLSAGMDVGSDKTDKNYQAVSEHVTETSFMVLGGNPSLASDQNAWMQSVPQNPAVIALTVAPYIDMLPVRVREATTSAVVDYLKGNLVVDNFFTTMDTYYSELALPGGPVIQIPTRTGLDDPYSKFGQCMDKNKPALKFSECSSWTDKHCGYSTSIDEAFALRQNLVISWVLNRTIFHFLLHAIQSCMCIFIQQDWRRYLGLWNSTTFCECHNLHSRKSFGPSLTRNTSLGC